MHKLKDFVKNHELFFVKTGQTVKDAVSLMTEKNIGAVCVLDGEELVGMFTERDLMMRVVNHERLKAASTLVDDVMTKDLKVADADEDITDTLNTMKKRNFRHMPVIEKDKLIGIVSLRQLQLHDASIKEDERNLRDVHITYSPIRMEGE
ncbi:MAG: CBS domain-containing protein [candidate division Zixibacteria bacterium]|nr:CBS domain-containing protein [candidate division Zixibacteria bacterium]